jgi:hypothetical protein
MRTALNPRSHRVRKSFESLNREIPGAGPQGDSIVGKSLEQLDCLPRVCSSQEQLKIGPDLDFLGLCEHAIIPRAHPIIQRMSNKYEAVGKHLTRAARCSKPSPSFLATRNTGLRGSLLQSEVSLES